MRTVAGCGLPELQAVTPQIRGPAAQDQRIDRRPTQPKAEKQSLIAFGHLERPQEVHLAHVDFGGLVGEDIAPTLAHVERAHRALGGVKDP